MIKTRMVLAGLSIILLSSLGFAAETGKTSSPATSAATKQDNRKPKVLDFDADVIEGERKTPSVFLEIGTENPTMDSVIFQRNDFNDFHALDAKRRQQYQPLYSK